MEENYVKGRKVLVTGGAGFIGSNLIESMLSHGNHVVCLDNFSTGKRANLEGFEKLGDFKLIEGDIRDAATCLKATEGMDIVYHQAALGSVPRSVKDPVSTTDVNIGGFVRMLFAAKECGVKRFVYATSSSVYGSSKKLPKVEEEIGTPLSPYAITKYANELFAANFTDIYGIDVVGLRYFNVFGRRQDPEGQYAAVIPKFLMLLKQHKSPVINGDGSFSRDFTYIDNVLLANHLAGITNNEKALNRIYNIACGNTATLNWLFEMLRTFAGKFDKAVLDINPEYGPVREGDIPHSHASIEKASELLGYKPITGVEEGLEATVDWFWNRL